VFSAGLRVRVKSLLPAIEAAAVVISGRKPRIRFDLNIGFSPFVPGVQSPCTIEFEKPLRMRTWRFPFALE
jgi:hypothetical protein